MFFELVPCDSELNGRLTTSFLNGVQKLASAVISPTKLKTSESVFTWLFLLLDAGQLFHNLLVHGVPEVASSAISRNITKI
ncbi:hypothetical protein EAC26_02695 [Enterococcus faecium]|nr:hypothetical protein [Enterococcus faecium]EGP5302817.1 hypothetical protein [Enterococcus faecium]EGP5326894.1 hypothetical protein [Enterococcus faecium]EGP5431099.1 hypothetical protein [Enterococcus faecium]EGP5665412.1 hypothetical protein [Enterococcus faecium]